MITNEMYLNIGFWCVIPFFLIGIIISIKEWKDQINDKHMIVLLPILFAFIGLVAGPAIVMFSSILMVYFILYVGVKKLIVNIDAYIKERRVKNYIKQVESYGDLKFGELEPVNVKSNYKEFMIVYDTRNAKCLSTKIKAVDAIEALIAAERKIENGSNFRYDPYVNCQITLKRVN